MPQTTPNQDFQPLPKYTESSTSNQTWVAITFTKEDAEGNVTQVQTIAPKR
jgi:hypothetical protein